MDLGRLSLEEIEKAGFFSIHSLPATTHGFNGAILDDENPFVFYRFPETENEDDVDILAGNGERWNMYRLSSNEMKGRMLQNKPIDICKRNFMYSDKSVVALVKGGS